MSQTTLNWASREIMARVAVAMACFIWGGQIGFGAPLHQGLVAYWPLDEGAGDVAGDDFGAVRDLGQLRNDPQWLGPGAAMLGNSALRFDGFDQDVLLSESDELDIGTNTVSVSAWVNFEFLPTELIEPFGGIFDSSQDSYILYLDRGNQELRFKVTDSDGTAERPGVPESMLTTETWHHVLGVYDGNEGVAKIYYDGEPVDVHSNSDLSNLVRPGQLAGIGANPTVDPGNPSIYFFPGAIDDVAVWDRPLGHGEAAYLYDSGSGRAVGAANPDIPFLPDEPPVEPVPPTVGPVIHYGFEGNLQNDGSGGAGLNGVLLDTPGINDALYTPGTVGQALDLRENPVSQAAGGDGVSVDFQLPDNGTIVFDYTVDEYFDYQSLWTNSIDPNDWEMWIYNDGRLRGRVEDDAFVTFDLDNLSGTGETYEIAFTWQRDNDNVEVKLYVDGELRDQDLVGTWVDPGETFFIAGGDDANHFGNGVWDEFRIYDATLSAGEILYLFSGATLPVPLRPGDADQDLDFDQLDLVQVQIAAKYLSGQPATWGEGDWDGGPGGEVGNPPAGNGLFDQMDIIAALTADVYLTGPYGALAAGPGRAGDDQTSLVYDAGTGELSVDAPAGKQLTSINITSADSKLVGDKPAVLDGSFDNFAADNVFKATFGSSFGSISFGNVLPAGLSEADVTSDLSVVGSLAGGGDLGDVDLVYVPEPLGLATALLGIALVTINLRPRRSGEGKA